MGLMPFINSPNCFYPATQNYFNSNLNHPHSNYFNSFIKFIF